MTEPHDPGLRGALDRSRAATDGRLHAASTERNREAILSVLAAVLHAQPHALRALSPDAEIGASWPSLLPRSKLVTVLEIGSGTGQHAAWFTPRLPGVEWVPSDVDPEVLQSIRAWVETELGTTVHRDRVMEPRVLDVAAPTWDTPVPDVMVCINVLHIAPWSVTEALFAGAAKSLRSGATLSLYGPYLHGNGNDAESNLDFDARLKERDPSFGVRAIVDVVAAAATCGLRLGAKVPMPNNNTSLVFVRD